jgi:hypothetical protein
LALGAVRKPVSFDEPQEPLTASRALQDAVEPPFQPAQDHVHGPSPATEEGSPALQR